MTASEPILLLTRPAPDSRRFATALKARLGYLPRTIISPLLEIVPVRSPLPAANASALIFTSARAVREASDVEPGLTAFCVGDSTAKAAARAGFRAISASGSADELIDLILRRRPAGLLLHIRGEKTRGDVAERLQEGGITVETLVRYRQMARELSKDAREAMDGDQPVIAPVFSPDSASALAAQAPFSAPLTICAMSKAAAAAFEHLPLMMLAVSARPTAEAMCGIVAGALSEQASQAGPA